MSQLVVIVRRRKFSLDRISTLLSQFRSSACTEHTLLKEKPTVEYNLGDVCTSKIENISPKLHIRRGMVVAVGPITEHFPLSTSGISSSVYRIAKSLTKENKKVFFVVRPRDRFVRVVN